MFQIIFNELSAAEISALPKRLQLELLAEFQILPEDLDQLDSERFGVIQREGKKLYRYRAEQEGCGYTLARGLFVLIALLVALFFVFSCGALAVYTSVARDLPPASELKNRAAQFNSTRILDRNGKLLYELNDPNEGRRIAVPLAQVPAPLLEATIATEDPSFYSNPGFDVVGIARALYRVLVRGEEVGGSTITQTNRVTNTKP